ncbi:MAG TPA: hypothetical protein VM818_20020 [Vicinamibacterales bacterium]|nr:hypothetical protein [Vicinamibacterales bacterium]
MNQVGWMIAASVASAVAASLLLGTAIAPEIMMGMLGPLLAASGTWLLVEQSRRRNSLGLTAVMFKAFAAKMLLFAAYVIVALKGLRLRPVPFVISFTTYFIVLHLTEALWLRRMFADAHRASH